MYINEVGSMSIPWTYTINWILNKDSAKGLSRWKLYDEAMRDAEAVDWTAIGLNTSFRYAIILCFGYFISSYIRKQCIKFEYIKEKGDELCKTSGVVTAIFARPTHCTVNLKSAGLFCSLLACGVHLMASVLFLIYADEKFPIWMSGQIGICY